MQFNLYTDIHKFYNDTYDVLMRHEAQNIILLGNLIIGYGGKDKTGWRDPVNWFMATVSDTNGILITALMTPPHNITLYATDNKINDKAVKCLMHGLENHEIPGVTTEKLLAEAFAKKYTTRKNLTCKTIMDQRIYRLTEVNPEIKQFGNLRLMDESDMHFFPFWMESFHSANIYGRTEMLIPRDVDEYHYRLSTKKLYALEVDGAPVSMAGFTRVMQTTIGVAFVYTPPYYRERGYASSCVAKLSQIALDQGYTKCVLYTDLLNPISNSIYQKIGYKAICDSLMLKFE